MSIDSGSEGEGLTGPILSQRTLIWFVVMSLLAVRSEDKEGIIQGSHSTSPHGQASR